MSLRFLADESCDFSVVRCLRAEGHEVLSVSEITSRSDDQQLIRQAFQEKRILLTEDKDFGWLVFVSAENTSGVILIRFPADARATLPKAVSEAVRTHVDVLPHSFVVIQPGQVRISQKPKGFEVI